MPRVKTAMPATAAAALRVASALRRARSRFSSRSSSSIAPRTASMIAAPSPRALQALLLLGVVGGQFAQRLQLRARLGGRVVVLVDVRLLSGEREAALGGFRGDDGAEELIERLPHLQRVSDPVIRLPYLTDVDIGDGRVEKQGDADGRQARLQARGDRSLHFLPSDSPAIAQSPCRVPRFMYGASYSRAPARSCGRNLTPPPRRFAPPLLKAGGEKSKPHQIFARSSGLRHMGSPSLMPKAS